MTHISQMALPFRHGVCTFSLENPVFLTFSCRADRHLGLFRMKYILDLLIQRGQTDSSEKCVPHTIPLKGHADGNPYRPAR